MILQRAITNTFDPLARLLSTTLKDNAGAVLNAHSYTYNAGNFTP